MLARAGIGRRPMRLRKQISELGWQVIDTPDGPQLQQRTKEMKFSPELTEIERMMSQKMTVGYIGLGLMGKSMARNILRAGYPLVVHNRSQAAVDELVAEGARRAHSPSEVAGQVDVVFTNLPDSPDVESRGVRAGWHPGRRSPRPDFRG